MSWLLALALATQVIPAPGVRLSDTIDPLREYRICGVPERESDGDIARSATVLRAYRRLHPCPATGLSEGACPGWQINHVIPLASGGCDSVVNLQWVPVRIKTCGAPWCIDRWERRYYRVPRGVVTWP